MHLENLVKQEHLDLDLDLDLDLVEFQNGGRIGCLFECLIGCQIER